MAKDFDAEIRFYGGVEGRIGGNAVVLTIKKGNKSFSYFFDFGINLQEYSRHRQLGGRPETLEQFQRWGFFPEFEKTEVRACFISHGHDDHWLALPALNKSTFAPQTIWTTKVTKQVIGASGDTRIIEKPLCIYPFEHGNFYYDHKALTDNMRINIAPFPVDHSIPGSCAFLIEMKNGIIVYTGDFRDHGLLSMHLEQQFWSYVRKRSHNKKVVLICEGTNYGTPYRFATEEGVKIRLKEILRNYQNELLTIIINEKDLWRMLVIQQAVEDLRIKENIERHVIYCESTSRLARRLHHSFREDYKAILNKPILESFARYLLIHENQIFKTYDKNMLTKIVENPSKYIIVATRREGFKACDSIANKMKYRAIGGCCVLSLSETFEEEVGVSTRDYAKSVAELGFSPEEVHSSGHVFPNRLLNILNKLHPDCIFILHTLAPQGLKNFIKARIGIEAITPEIGVPHSV